MKETINKDTYQTLKELKVSPQPYEKNITPLWKSTKEVEPNHSNQPSLFVATPVLTSTRAVSCAKSPRSVDLSIF